MTGLKSFLKEMHTILCPSWKGKNWTVRSLQPICSARSKRLLITQVEIESDNKEVIRIVNGQPPLPMDDAIILLIREMKCRGWTTIFQHIEREANGVADRLAKMMRGETLGGQIFLQPPAVVTELMELEARASVDLLGH
ncbi:hypothetical protein V6N11_018515 [Hibiscus sabdariffa]|uniref:RNase H type-1 domain-containing protein n=1 Tax=Hibiscus sabdariffa TaxID=183260 RepID=A0ABR2T7Z0_9ROSI